MGCIVTKLEFCVIAKCFHCIHLRLGCILIAAFAITFWIAIILYFLLDDGVGFFSKVNDSWIHRGYILAMLGEAAIRIVISIVLIIGAAKKRVKLLTVFLVTWLLLVMFILSDMVLAILLSRVDGATVLFSLAYAGGRSGFTVLALVIVNSYRIQLINEENQRQKTRPIRGDTPPELVL